MELNLEQSLEQIENSFWGEAQFDSYVVKTCHLLRKLPLHSLTTEHLRLGIGQKMGLPTLIPLALKTLEDTPLIEACYYPGDLLEMVLRCSNETAFQSSDMTKRLVHICNTVHHEKFSDYDIDYPPSDLFDKITDFLSKVQT